VVLFFVRVHRADAARDFANFHFLRVCTHRSQAPRSNVNDSRCNSFFSGVIQSSLQGPCHIIIHTYTIIIIISYNNIYICIH